MTGVQTCALPISDGDAVAWFAKGYFNWTLAHQAWLRAGVLFAIITVSAIVYFALLFALGFRFGDFKRRSR